MKKLIVLTVVNVVFAIVAVHKVHQWQANAYIEPWDNTVAVHQT